MTERITRRASELANLAVFADCFGADLYPLATMLEPLSLKAGDLVMRQGEDAEFFLIINSGSVVVEHHYPDGTAVEIPVEAGRIVGEMALLRHSRRVANVRAVTDLTGWTGDDDAFDQLIALPGVLALMIRTARGRLAAFIKPIPFQLRDGTDLLLRPVLPGDDTLVEKGHVVYSTQTMYRRFMTAREPTPALMEYLFQVDYVNHFVWVVTDPSGQDVVADARYVREDGDRSVAEIAFIVGDEYQGHGIGAFLMKALVVAAHIGGVDKFTARVLSENRPMRKIFEKYGAKWEYEDLGVVLTEFDVPPISEVNLPDEMIDQIRDVTRQVLQALG